MTVGTLWMFLAQYGGGGNGGGSSALYWVVVAIVVVVILAVGAWAVSRLRRRRKTRP
jgi:membrane-anchored protein YejM (alkaline phosphatase superfamily)